MTRTYRVGPRLVLVMLCLSLCSSAPVFAQRAEQIGLRYRLGRRLEGGFNMNGGRQVSFAIYRAEPPL